MNKLVKSQCIFIQSKNRTSGTTYNFDIDFRNQYISCEDDELMSITLLNFNMYCDWYVVNDTNNNFSIRKLSNNETINITIPTGNYPYKTLYQTINLLYGSKVCNFSKIQNKFFFTFSEPHQITFQDKSKEILGFTNNAYTGSVIMSDYVLNPTKLLDSICVSMNGVQPYKCYNLSNNNGFIEISNMLCAIPFVSAPYDIFTYSNTGDNFKLFVFDKNIQKLSFRITDFDGNDLTYIPEFTMCLKVDTYIEQDEDEQLQVSKKILEYTKMNFLTKHLRM